MTPRRITLCAARIAVALALAVEYAGIGAGVPAVCPRAAARLDRTALAPELCTAGKHRAGAEKEPDQAQGEFLAAIEKYMRENGHVPTSWHTMRRGLERRASNFGAKKHYTHDAQYAAFLCLHGGWDTYMAMRCGDITVIEGIERLKHVAVRQAVMQALNCWLSILCKTVLLVCVFLLGITFERTIGVLIGLSEAGPWPWSSVAWASIGMFSLLMITTLVGSLFLYPDRHVLNATRPLDRYIMHKLCMARDDAARERVFVVMAALVGVDIKVISLDEMRCVCTAREQEALAAFLARRLALAQMPRNDTETRLARIILSALASGDALACSA